MYGDCSRLGVNASDRCKHQGNRLKRWQPSLNPIEESLCPDIPFPYCFWRVLCVVYIARHHIQRNLVVRHTTITANCCVLLPNLWCGKQDLGCWRRWFLVVINSSIRIPCWSLGGGGGKWTATVYWRTRYLRLRKDILVGIKYSWQFKFDVKTEPVSCSTRFELGWPFNIQTGLTLSPAAPRFVVEWQIAYPEHIPRLFSFDSLYCIQNFLHHHSGWAAKFVCALERVNLLNFSLLGETWMKAWEFCGFFQATGWEKI